MFFSRSSFPRLELNSDSEKWTLEAKSSQLEQNSSIQRLRLECAILLKIIALPVPRYNRARKKNLQPEKNKNKATLHNRFIQNAGAIDRKVAKRGNGWD